MRLTAIAVAALAALAGTASAADPKPAAAPAPAPAALSTVPNLIYAFNTKTATFNPEKGTLTLKGLTDYALAVGSTPDGPSFSRRDLDVLFGKKKRTPAFDTPAEVVIEGKKGLPAGHKLILAVSAPKMDGPNTLVFGKATQMTGNYTAGGLAADTVSRSTEGALITDADVGGAPVSVDDALVVAHVTHPNLASHLAAQRTKAAKDPPLTKAAKAAAKPAAPPAPAPDAAAAKPAAAAPPADAAKPPPAKPPAPGAPPPADAAAKPPPPAAPKPAAAPAPTTPARRRLLQGQNCGVCEYANNAGACVVVSQDDCDGVTGQSGEWNCGTCQFFTQDDYEGHCETASNC